MGLIVSEVPVLQDEVNRKAFEALDNLVVRREAGKITDAQFAVGIEVLFDALSGLVSDGDFFYITGELRKRVSTKTKNAAIYINTDTKKLVIGMHTHGNEDMQVYSATNYERQYLDLSEHHKPDLEAKNKIERLGERLIKFGFQRIL